MDRCLLFLYIVLTLTQAMNFTYTEGYQDTITRVRDFPNHLSSLFITTTATECEKCDTAIKVYEEFMYEVDSVVKVLMRGDILYHLQTYVLDCKHLPAKELDNIPACHEGNVDQLPGLTFLSPPSEESTQPQLPIEKQFTGPLSLQGLLEYAYKNAPNFSMQIEDEEQFDQLFLKDTNIPNKVLLLKADDFTPFWFKGLTSAFKGRLDFGEVEIDILKKRYQLSGKVSELIILTYDTQKKSYNHIVYQDGKRYSTLKKYLKQFALKQVQRKTKSIYEEDPKRWNKVEHIIQEQLSDVLNLEQQWVLIHFVDHNSQITHPQFKYFKKELKGLVKILQMNCTNTCVNNKWIKKNIRQYPELVVLPFINKKVTKPIHIRNKDKIEDISELMFDQIISQTLDFKQVNEQLVLSECKQAIDQEYYAVLWHFQSNQYYNNLIAATISSLSKYKKHMKFHFSKDPSKQSLDQYSIESIPHIQTFVDMDLSTGQHRKYDFQGNWKFEEILSYFNQIGEEKEKQNQQTLHIAQGSSQEDFDVHCGSHSQLCMIALLDTMKEGRNKKDMEIFLKLKDQFKKYEFNWVWIDGRCQFKILKKLKLNVDNLGYFLMYNPTNNKFAIYNEEMNVKKTALFIQQNYQKKSAFKSFKKEIFDFEEIDCASISEQLRQEYKEEKRRRQQMFIQAERERDKENEKLKLLEEQRKLLFGDDEDENNYHNIDHKDEDL